jgi:hypothetical protein
MLYRLVDRWELVCETLAWYNGTLIDECATIGVIVVCLEDSVPMLYKAIIKIYVRV